MFKVTIAGHLGKDPETRFTPNGTKVTSFTVAVNQRKGKEEVTTWVRITSWGDGLDKMIAYLKKGSPVIVSGRLNPPTTYTDREGNIQITIEVTAEAIDFSPFGRGDKPSEGGTAPSSQAASYSYESGQEGSATPYGRQGSSLAGQSSRQADLDDDTLPF